MDDKAPRTPLEAYQAIIDGLVRETRAHSVKATRVETNELFPERSAGARHNEFLRTLTPDQRKNVAELIREERDGAIHDVLAALTWWMTARDLQLTWGGQPMPTDLSDMGLHGDYVGRCNGWPWPSDQGTGERR
jgi:hypothetical protein